MTVPLTIPTRGEAAIAYAGRGWPVLPLHWMQDGCCSCGDPACRTPAKHPFSSLVPRGVHDATAITDVVATWWRREPRCNVGIRTGPESQLVLLDIDVRPDKDGEASLRSLVATLGPLPDTVEAITGSGSRHLLFAWPGHDVPGKLGDGVDIKGRGGYFVAAPSTHASGRAYEWEASGHPDDVPVAALPDAWLARMRFAGPPAPAATATVTGRALSALEVAKVRSALGVLTPGEYDDWIGAGMALHHETGGSDQAFGLWWEWSATWAAENPRSEKVDLKAVRRHWKSFARDGGTRRTFGWLYHRAAALGWVAPAPVLVPTTALLTPTAFDEALAHNAPGVLGTIVRWSLATAPCPVPLYSLAAAIGIGAVAAGRRYTLGGTPSHLYVLVAGRTASGKDHVKGTVASVLEHHPHLLGPGEFASDSAVLSALRDRPQLIAVLDEFGQQLASTRGQGSHHRASALRMLMEAWSARILLGKALSTLSLAPKDAPPPVQVKAPSLTVLALTTPTRLHEALEMAHAADGFLNRFLLLEHDAPRVVPTARPTAEPPAAVRAWLDAMLAGMPPVAGVGVSPHDVPTTEDAAAALLQVAADATAAANDLDTSHHGAGGLWGRAAEQVRRLTLVAALADASSPLEAVADVQHVAWARAVVWWSQGLLVRTAMERIGDTEEARGRSAALQAIQRAGAAGVSRRDLMRTTLRALRLTDTRAIFDWLEATDAVHVQQGPRGTVRYFVAPDDPD